MSVSHEIIERNLIDIRERIARAAEKSGRGADAVRLVAVTKTVGVDEVRALKDLGVTDFGENRPEVAAAKVSAFKDGVRWHMIGSIQRRKIPEVLGLFDCIDSVDRIEVGETLDKRAAELGRVVPVLIEMNVSGEESKHGFEADDLGRVLDGFAPLDHVRVEGLMTMAPFVADPEEARPVFARMREIAVRFGLRELSMGMSNDYEVAIEEGATQVRIGTALFE